MAVNKENASLPKNWHWISFWMRHATASAHQVCAQVGSAASITKWATWAWNNPAVALGGSQVGEEWARTGRVAGGGETASFCGLTKPSLWPKGCFFHAASHGARNWVLGFVEAVTQFDGPSK